MASSSSTQQPAAQRVRQLWRAFEQWQTPRRTTLTQQLKALDSTASSTASQKSQQRQKRSELESKFFLSAREEWHKRLASAGLKDDDWGQMSAAETKAVEDALGAFIDNSSSSSSAGNAAAAPASSATSTSTSAKDDTASPSALTVAVIPVESTSSSSSANSLSLVPAPHALALTSPTSLVPPPPQMNSSLSTSSLASSISAGYELVNPSDLGSDDDRDDEAAGFFFNMAVNGTDLPPTTIPASRHSASASEDELPLNVPFTGTASATTTTSWRPSQYADVHQYTSTSTTSATSYSYNGPPNWSSDSLLTSSSRHASANTSPAQPPPKTFGMTSMSKTAMSSFSSAPTAPNAAAPTSSGWTTAAYTTVSSASLFGTSPPPPSAFPSVPSSSASSNLAIAKITSSSSTSSPASTTSVSASASASASKSQLATSMALVPAPTNGGGSSKEKKPRPYIGPVLHDPDEAYNEELSFEKFKLQTRINKIIEFHKAAAELEIKLAVDTCKSRWEENHQPKDGSSSQRRDKTADKKLIEQHERDLRKLQEEKEAERKKLVKEERKRRRSALAAAAGGSGGSSSSAQPGKTRRGTITNASTSNFNAGAGPDTAWLDAYNSSLSSADFQVSVPGGLEGWDQPPIGHDSAMSNGFGQQQQYSPPQQMQIEYPGYSGSPYDYQQHQHQQQQAQDQYSPSLFSPTTSSSSKAASPSSFWDPNHQSPANDLAHQNMSSNNRRPPRPADSPEMFIARPRPMPAWNPAQLLTSSESEGEYDGYDDDDRDELGFDEDEGPGKHQQLLQQQQSQSQQQQLYAQQHQQQQHPSGYESYGSGYDERRFVPPKDVDDDDYNRSRNGSEASFHQGFGAPSLSLDDMDVPEELRQAMSGFGYHHGHTPDGHFGYSQDYDYLGHQSHSSSTAGSDVEGYESSNHPLGGMFGRREQSQLPPQQQQPTRATGRGSGAGGRLPIPPSMESSIISSSSSTGDMGATPRLANQQPKAWGGRPAALKDTAESSSKGDLNGMNGSGVLSKTPTTSSPLAGLFQGRIPNPFSGLANSTNTVVGGGAGARRDQRREDQEDEEEDEDAEGEEDDEEDERDGGGKNAGSGGGGLLSGWFRQSGPAQPQPPAPTARSQPPPSAPAPATTQNNGKKAATTTTPATTGPMNAKARRAAAKAAAEAKAQAEAEAKALEEEAKAKAKAEEEVRAKAKAEEEARARAEAEAAAKAKPAVPPKDVGGKKQTKKQRLAAKKGAGKAEPAPVVEEKKEDVPASKKTFKETEESKKPSPPPPPASATPSWGDTSITAASTPRPAANANGGAKSGWGIKSSLLQPPSSAQSQSTSQSVQETSTPRPAPSMLRKQAMLQQASHQGAYGGVVSGASGVGGVPAIDTTPLPADIRESMWSRAGSTKPPPSATSSGGSAASTPTAASSSAWSTGGGRKAGSLGVPSRGRRNSDPVSPSVRELELPEVPGAFQDDSFFRPPQSQSTAQPQSASAFRPKSSSTSANGGKRRGAVPMKRNVTIEEVSDEEDGLLDGSLPLTSRYLLQPTNDDEPPSPQLVPSTLGQQQKIKQPQPSMPPGSFNNFFGYDNVQHHPQYSSSHSNNSSFDSVSNRSYGSSMASTAPTSPSDEGPPPSNEDLFSAAAKQLRQSGQLPPPSVADTGFQSDWGATVKAKRPRWNTVSSLSAPGNVGRPASSVNASSNAGGASSAFRTFQSSGLAAPRMTGPTSSSESDDMPGGFGSGVGARGVGGVGGNVNAMWDPKRQQQQQGAAASRNGNSVTDKEDSDVLARFAQAQRLESAKWNKMQSGR